MSVGQLYSNPSSCGRIKYNLNSFPMEVSHCCIIFNLHLLILILFNNKNASHPKIKILRSIRTRCWKFDKRALGLVLFTNSVKGCLFFDCSSHCSLPLPPTFILHCKTVAASRYLWLGVGRPLWT